MKNALVILDTRRITDWESFHTVFAETFGFPEFELADEPVLALSFSA